jgi:outer membrane protein OmpA-like peptidoglycan-associated protein
MADLALGGAVPQWVPWWPGLSSPAHRPRVRAGSESDLPPIVNEVLATSGRALDAGAREFFQPRFGADFSAVRVHEDTRAAASAQAINALAYTSGTHIIFGAGRFAPHAPAGRRLLAHELAHVVQQGRGADVGLQRQEVPIQPTCAGMPYDPLRECCCDDTVTAGPCAVGAGCAYLTSRDNEYDGCSVPDWLAEDPDQKDNPGGAHDTWFSDRSIQGTQPRSFAPRLPCDVHDKCYQTCGSNRLACDDQLIDDARAVCNDSMQRGRALQDCLAAVDFAETWLSRGSRGAFNQRQRDYCACCPVPKTHDSTTITFDTGLATFNQAARDELDRFVDHNRALLRGGNYEMQLIGQASRLGDPGRNRILSEQRWAAVWLAIEARLGSKLDPARVDPVALGEELAEREGAPDDDNDPAYRSVQINLRGRVTPAPPVPSPAPP